MRFPGVKIPFSFWSLDGARLECRQKYFNTKNSKGYALIQFLFHVELRCQSIVYHFKPLFSDTKLTLLVTLGTTLALFSKYNAPGISEMKRSSFHHSTSFQNGDKQKTIQRRKQLLELNMVDLSWSCLNPKKQIQWGIFLLWVLSNHEPFHRCTVNVEIPCTN